LVVLRERARGCRPFKKDERSGDVGVDEDVTLIEKAPKS
jgi:hypothetical protein